MKRKRSREEEKVLFLDDQVIWGWEASHLLVVDEWIQADSSGLKWIYEDLSGFKRIQVQTFVIEL